MQGPIRKFEQIFILLHLVLSILYSVLEGMLRCICSFNLSISKMKGSESDNGWLGFASTLNEDCYAAFCELGKRSMSHPLTIWFWILACSGSTILIPSYPSLINPNVKAERVSRACASLFAAVVQGVFAHVTPISYYYVEKMRLLQNSWQTFLKSGGGREPVYHQNKARD